MTFPSSCAPLVGISRARLPAWALPDGWPTRANGEPLLADLAFRDGRIAALTPTDQPTPGLWDLAGALTLPGLVEPHAHLDKTFTIERCRPAPDAWQEIARLDTGGITLERVALVPLPLFQDPVEAEAIARAVANSGERCLLGGFIHSSNWDAAAMENLLCSAARWDLDLDLHIDEELSEVSQGLTWLADHLSRHPFPGHICCSHGCALAAGSDEQAAPILRQLAAHGVTLIALPMTNLLLQDATFGRTPRQRGITLLHEAQAAGVATLLGCDNVQDAFCPAGSYDPLDTLACGLFSAQLSDLFDRQSRLICDRAALTGSPADAAPFAVGAAASVVIFPGSDRFTWPLNSAARLVVNHGRLTHRRVWQEEMAHES
ncbi:amidohydrolase family protein [Klebsiella pneumoniae]|nr:cytosine deaminase [Klebsiella pneumoniae]